MIWLKSQLRQLSVLLLKNIGISINLYQMVLIDRSQVKFSQLKGRIYHHLIKKIKMLIMLNVINISHFKNVNI